MMRDRWFYGTSNSFYEYAQKQQRGPVSGIPILTVITLAVEDFNIDGCEKFNKRAES
jgi:hypothetical protein